MLASVIDDQGCFSLAGGMPSSASLHDLPQMRTTEKGPSALWFTTQRHHFFIPSSLPAFPPYYVLPKPVRKGDSPRQYLGACPRLW